MNWSELRADVDFHCGSTSGSYSDADKMRNMQVAYQGVATLIWESDPTYSFDDRNNTGSSKAYRTIANASASYLIPTTALRVRGVEIKDSQGNWSKLSPITYEDMVLSPEEYLRGTGLPIKYMLEGAEIRLLPAPGTGFTTMASGMAVILSRDVSAVSPTATSTSPGFAAPYHRILSYAASIDFVQDKSHRDFLLGQKIRLERGMSKFYSNWAPQYKTTIKPHSRRTWRRYT
jgi:hypothetical protein